VLQNAAPSCFCTSRVLRHCAYAPRIPCGAACFTKIECLPGPACHTARSLVTCKGCPVIRRKYSTISLQCAMAS
jgi:hypothetical protein